MDEAVAARYWCHMCSQMVNPIMEVEIKCPICGNGFVEEMVGGAGDGQEPDSNFGSERALSLWAPLLLGMMGHPRRRRRARRLEFDDEDDDTEDSESRREGETELDREIESIIQRRRRSSATILQLLHGIRAGIAAESEIANRHRDIDREDGERDRDRDREREREPVILINPINQTIIVQSSSYDATRAENTIGSLGDYFVGPGLDLLLQHLAENDPNRYGTPPAQKEAVEAMPTVAIKESLQCSVCLDDFEIGAEAKEMPCKHKFHSGCILPWLELHSSCPVCRYQLPADESKLDSDGSRNVNTNNRSQRERESESESENDHGSGEDGDGDERNGSNRRFSIPWPFSLFSSSSGSQSGGGGNSPSSSSGSPSNAHESASHREEN